MPWHEVTSGPCISGGSDQGKTVFSVPKKSTNRIGSWLFVISAPDLILLAHWRPLQPATLSDFLFVSHLRLSHQVSHHSHSFQSSILFDLRVHRIHLRSFRPHLTNQLQAQEPPRILHHVRQINSSRSPLRGIYPAGVCCCSPRMLHCCRQVRSTVKSSIAVVLT